MNDTLQCSGALKMSVVNELESIESWENSATTLSTGAISVKSSVGALRTRHLFDRYSLSMKENAT